ncbi:MAG: alpha/beta fold hydrolase [Armatimonadota bacterium]
MERRITPGKLFPGNLLSCGRERRVMPSQVRSMEVSFELPFAVVSGTLVLPSVIEEVDCAVIAGGTFSHTRDGFYTRPGAPPRDALRRLARELALAGYASFRYDRPGYGLSRARDGWSGTYSQQAEVLLRAVETVRQRKGIRRVFVIGESSGAYVTCLSARRGLECDACVFLGPFCGEVEEIFDYNYGRLARLAEEDSSWREWAERTVPEELVLGRKYPEMLEAARSGERTFRLQIGSQRKEIALDRRIEEITLPAPEQFRHIRVPALVMAGNLDENVPPQHAERAEWAIRSAPNNQVERVIIRGADHSFQEADPDRHRRLRDRYSLQSFTRPYSRRFYQELVAWLDRTFSPREP